MSTKTIEKRDLSVGALAVTVVLWASAFVGIRDAADSFSAGPLSLGRLVVAALVLTVLSRPWRHRLPSGRPFLLLVLAGVTWFGAYNVALNAGEQQVDAGTAALVVTVGPILIALFAGVLLKEGFPKPLLIGIAVAASGVVLISLSTRDESAVDTASTTGVLLCLAAAVLYAVGALAQKPTLTVVTPVMSVWLMCVVGAVVCLPYLPALVRELGNASTADIVWLVYLGVFPTAIGFSTWSYALKRLSAGQVASATYLVPAVATLISWVMLDEVPAALAFVGGALCLVGVAITRYRKRTGPAAGSPDPAGSSTRSG
ncbi:DMT family transporter [Aeromicrobium sp.]|uniref:DMT family transporter n=1 Tax=Aeromicrobium sp. TaxID=1871063 RepID=UPI003D6BFC2A